jgi:uncharacterized protein (UPF0548 family)
MDRWSSDHRAGPSFGRCCGVIGLRKPSEAALHAFVQAQGEVGLSYAEVGATRDGAMPAGYRVDTRREVIGSGDAFERAVAALDGWQMHLGAGVQVVPVERPREGLTVALVVRASGLWTTSACRVVYTIDEPDRYGFAYGTLADHAVAGEERFLVERSAGGEVSFELTAFSRANSWLFKLASPIARRKQLALGAAYIAALISRART